MDQDEVEPVSVIPPEPQPDAVDATAIQDEVLSKPPSPQPQLSMTLQTSSELSIDLPGNTLDASLDPLDADMSGIVGVALGDKDGIVELDMSSLGPDGLGLEGTHDLSQMEETDLLIGGPMMPETSDPFAGPVNE
jgi:hypothetical protein